MIVFLGSHDAIILVAVIGSLASLLILILSCCLCVKCCVEKSMKNSYDTTDRHQGYDNYITTKDMETNHNVKLQMYSFDSPPEAQRYDVLNAPKVCICFSVFCPLCILLKLLRNMSEEKSNWYIFETLSMSLRDLFLESYLKSSGNSYYYDARNGNVACVLAFNGVEATC
ncbi:uncharacterized protein LOC130625169 [Hydractinia symbiolongicarpus]|uniref:uncharacterized protein LOC130625169 n=1 Tax=Hydractinia symbiolongicarpus TaxID=13093 RepID=UPI00254ECD75|nr:uncharacterized protein LOC130625169 [Hydractinia symbiolongicarpus]